MSLPSLTVRRRLSLASLLLLAPLLAPAAQAQTWTQLAPLPGGMQGSPMVNSNNPESVSREGLLLASDPMNSQVAGQVSRTLTTGTLDSSCPAGSLREFSFYMHHILAAPSGNDRPVERIYAFLEPADGNGATFNAYGAAISQRDITLQIPAGLTARGGESTLDPGRSPSYSVSLASLTGRLPEWVSSSTFGSRFVNVRDQVLGSGGRFTLLNLGGTQGASLDARIKVRATRGCLRIRLVAASAANATEAAAYSLSRRQYAWGNVASTYRADGTVNTLGGVPCSNRQSQNPDGSFNWSGWGRAAGIYRFDRWMGTNTVSITSTAQRFGYQFLAAPSNVLRSTNLTTTPSGACGPTTADTSPSSNAQRAPAIRYYSANTSGLTGDRDSDPWSTANYGVEYMLTHSVANRTGGCINANLQVTMYPGQQSCDAFSGSPLTRHWDGAFKVAENGVLRPIVRTYVKCNASPGSRSVFIPQESRPASTIASKLMRPNETVVWDVQGFVPGLISAPGAFLINSTPAACP